jgi:hypothetical protein
VDLLLTLGPPDVSQHFEMSFKATVEDHDVECPLFRSRRFRQAGGTVTWRYTVAMRDMKAKGNAEEFLSEHAREAFRAMSFGLREHDPRIGTVLDEGQTKVRMPRSLLFDPPRVRPPAWKGNAGLDATPCPFCQDGFGRGYPAMWGGGNLFWVHPSCWMRAHE